MKSSEREGNRENYIRKKKKQKEWLKNKGRYVHNGRYKEERKRECGKNRMKEENEEGKRNDKLAFCLVRSYYQLVSKGL
jgi:hypothetical protein